MTKASVLSCGFVCEDDAPDGDTGASQGREEEGLGGEGWGEVGVLSEEVGEGDGAGEASGEREGVEG